MARLLHKLALATLLAGIAVGCGDDPARETLIVPTDAMIPLLVGERTELDTGAYRIGKVEL